MDGGPARGQPGTDRSSGGDKALRLRIIGRANGEGRQHPLQHAIAARIRAAIRGSLAGNRRGLKLRRPALFVLPAPHGHRLVIALDVAGGRVDVQGAVELLREIKSDILYPFSKGYFHDNSGPQFQNSLNFLEN